MRKMLVFGLIACLSLIAIVSAVSVNSVAVKTFKPGETGSIKLNVENVFDETVKNLVIDIDFANTPLNVVGSSSFGVNELKEDDDEVFAFGVRVLPTAKPGEYQLPYTISYMIGNVQSLRKSSIGVKITADTIVDYSANAENAIIGERGVIEIKIINKGLGHIGFASVKLLPKGFTLISDQEVYIGDVDSDDFEVASFDVLFTKQNIDAKAIVEYRDAENNLISENIEIPLVVYTREKALELGIVKKSNSILYISLAVIVIALWIVIRAIRKHRRLRNSRGG